MFNPSKRAVLTGVLATMIVSALAVAADNPLDTPPVVRAPAGESLYLVRCWQYGRLLFEERDLQLPPEVAASLKLRGTDRNRQQVFVTDTGNATCLIRSMPPSRR